jgi:hypothetical protein
MVVLRRLDPTGDELRARHDSWRGSMVVLRRLDPTGDELRPPGEHPARFDRSCSFWAWFHSFDATNGGAATDRSHG